MAGGTMTVTVPDYAMLPQVAQRVICWAGGPGGADARRVKVVTVTPGPAAVQIPEEIFAAHGPLMLKPDGVDILAGYVAGSHVTFSAANGVAARQDPGTCAADNAETPKINGIAMNFLGEPLSIGLSAANFTGNGQMDVTWGDGSTTVFPEGPGQGGHDYPYAGVFTIRLADASNPSLFTETTIRVP